MLTTAQEKEKAEAKKGNSWKGRLMFALRLVLSLGLLGYLFFGIVPADKRQEILGLYANVDFLYLGIAILFTFTDRVVSGIKWLALLRVKEPDTPLLPVMEIFFVTTFLGYFLPSSIGGDALRVYSMSRLKGDLASSASSVVLDRAYGTLGLLLIAALTLIPAFGEAIPELDAILIWIITLGAFFGVILFSSRRCHRFVERMGKLEKGGKIRGILLKLTTSFTSFVNNKWQLVKIFCLSLCVQILRVLIVLFLGLSLGIHIDPLNYFIYVPIITVITFLPVSIAGIGVREVLFVAFFCRPEIGLEEHVALSLSLMFFSMGIVATLPGAVVYLFTGMGRKKGGESQPVDSE